MQIQSSADTRRSHSKMQGQRAFFSFKAPAGSLSAGDVSRKTSTEPASSLCTCKPSARRETVLLSFPVKTLPNRAAAPGRQHTSSWQTNFFEELTLLTCNATSFSPDPKILIASFLWWYGCKAMMSWGGSSNNHVTASSVYRISDRRRGWKETAL